MNSFSACDLCPLTACGCGCVFASFSEWDTCSIFHADDNLCEDGKCCSFNEIRWRRVETGPLQKQGVTEWDTECVYVNGSILMWIHKRLNRVRIWHGKSISCSAEKIEGIVMGIFHYFQCKSHKNALHWCSDDQIDILFSIIHSVWYCVHVSWFVAGGGGWWLFSDDTEAVLVYARSS